MKKYFAIILIFSYCSIAKAQKNLQDVVYLKNDSINISDKALPIIQGYQGIAEFGYAFKTGDFGMDMAKVNLIHGYRVNPNLAFGLGTGIRYYFSAKRTIIPFFADVRINVFSKGVTPYMALGIGYSFNPTNDFKGEGILFNPSFGVRFRVTAKTILNVGIGYEKQKMKFTEGNFHTGISSTKTLDIQCISINIGTAF